MTRLTVEFSPEVDQEIQRIGQILGKTKAEVFRKALDLLNFTIGEQSKGSKLIFENEKEKTRKEVIKI